MSIYSRFSKDLLSSLINSTHPPRLSPEDRDDGGQVLQLGRSP